MAWSCVSRVEAGANRSRRVSWRSRRLVSRARPRRHSDLAPAVTPAWIGDMAVHVAGSMLSVSPQAAAYLSSIARSWTERFRGQSGPGFPAAPS
jgi:hypothetical protein